MDSLDLEVPGHGFPLLWELEGTDPLDGPQAFLCSEVGRDPLDWMIRSQLRIAVPDHSPILVMPPNACLRPSGLGRQTVRVGGGSCSTEARVWWRHGQRRDDVMMIIVHPQNVDADVAMSCSDVAVRLQGAQPRKQPEEKVGHACRKRWFSQRF